MNNLVATNVRFPKQELIEYKQMAVAEGKSLSEFLRIIVRGYSHQKKMSFKKVDFQKIQMNNTKSDEPIWHIKPWRSKFKDGAKYHDKYIYR